MIANPKKNICMIVSQHINNQLKYRLNMQVRKCDQKKKETP